MTILFFFPKNSVEIGHSVSTPASFSCSTAVNFSPMRPFPFAASWKNAITFIFDQKSEEQKWGLDLWSAVFGAAMQ